MAQDDRSTRARVRDAAIACYAEHGVQGTTARKVAEAAGVSPGSVIHHFGSMDGLRLACDEHVVATIRAEKSAALSEDATPDPLASMRGGQAGKYAGYIASVLHDDTPAVVRLVDELVADAETYLAAGVEAGTVRPSVQPEVRAALLTVMSLGTLVLGSHLERLIGVDPSDMAGSDSAALTVYAQVAMEIYGTGLFTDAFAERVAGSLEEQTR